MKITIIGGGSFMWTLGFVRQFAQSEPLAGSSVVLMDSNPEAVALTRRAGQICCDAYGKSIELTTSTDVDRSLADADFVIVCISTGGLDAMRHDLEIPEKYGIWHTVGDTVGPGGYVRAVRNIPVFYGLAEKMSRLCPQAWMLNVTNPLTVLTRVPQKCFGIKTVGMCGGVEETITTLAPLVGLDPHGRRDYIAAGVNHGSFYAKLFVDGVNVLEKLKEAGYCRSDGKLPVEVETDDPLAGPGSLRADFALWKELGYMPTIGDRHTVENYPWFLTDPQGKLDFGIKRTSIADRHEWRRIQRKRLEDYIADAGEKPGNMGHGDDPIGLVVEALSGFRSFQYSANFRNIGQATHAPVDAVVETRCLFDAAGVHPHPSPLPDVLKPIVLPTIARQEGIIDATLNGTFEQVATLVSTDPMCSRLPLGQCRQMVREMLTAQRQFIVNPGLLEE